MSDFDLPDSVEQKLIGNLFHFFTVIFYLDHSGVNTERFTDLGKQFPNDGSILGSSQFSILPQLPPKVLINSKVVKIDPKNNHLALLI